LKEEIEKLLCKFYDDTQFSLGILNEDEIKYLGFIKKEGKVSLIENQEEIFEIGSITKIFTSYVLSELVVEKKIKLENRISEYLSINSIEAQKITIMQLSNHTSGLPRLPTNFYTHKNYNEKDPYKNYNENCLNEYLKNQIKLETEPGRVFNYSNLGYGILSYIISKLEGDEFQSIVNKRIFAPLGMTNSSFQIKRIVKGIDQNGKDANNWHGGILNGCIGIVSTTSDLMKYMNHLLKEDNEISSLQMKESFKVENDYHIGLGWGIRNVEKRKTISHGGGSEGYNSYMKLDKVRKKGMVLLTNVSAFHEYRVELEKFSNKMMMAI
jgi:CubicO group peptidase (beta-lactamase class C family)